MGPSRFHCAALFLALLFHGKPLSSCREDQAARVESFSSQTLQLSYVCLSLSFAGGAHGYKRCYPGVMVSGGSQSGASTQSSAKPTLSIKDVRFDTKLSHETATVWFRRLRLAAETLSCDRALTDEHASDEQKRQAKFIIAANLPDDETHLLDSTPPTTAKQLYDKITAEYAGSTYLRKPELLQRLIYMRPQHEKLSDYLSRAIQLRAEMISAECGDEELISAMFLIALRDTERLHDWSVQQLQVSPPTKLPELVAGIKTVHRNLLDEVFNSTATSAHMTASG